jgi:hypothetical protein
MGPWRSLRCGNCSAKLDEQDLACSDGLLLLKERSNIEKFFLSLSESSAGVLAIAIALIIGVTVGLVSAVRSISMSTKPMRFRAVILGQHVTVESIAADSKFVDRKESE